jgi:hypothetical protein
MCKLKIITSRYDEVEKQLRVILCPEGGRSDRKGLEREYFSYSFLFLLLIQYCSYYYIRPTLISNQETSCNDAF